MKTIAKTTRAKSPKEPELIPKRPEPWTVSVHSMTRKNPSEKQKTISVNVVRLRHNGRTMMELEGPTAESSLRNLAAEWNEKGMLPVKLKRSAADMTEPARRQMHIKNATQPLGPDFTDEAVILREEARHA